MSNEIVLKESDFDLPADINQAVGNWEKIQTAKRQLKRMEEYNEERIKAFMQSNGLHEMPITETAKLILTVNKKNRYDTEAIYKALEFTDEQIAVLPATPQWRKTAILANEKTAVAWYEEESEELEPDGKAKKWLKELDIKFLR